MNRTLQTHCKYQYTSLVQKHNVDNMQTLAYANGFPVGSIYMKYDMHCFHLLSSSRRNCTGFYFIFSISCSLSPHPAGYLLPCVQSCSQTAICFHLLFWKEFHWILFFVIIVNFLLIQLFICFVVFSLDLIGFLHF